MRGLSRGALADAEQRLEPLLGTVEGTALGGELFAVAGLLDSSAGLRRALTDPSREGQVRASLASRVLTGKVGPATLDVVSGLVRERWSTPRDLADALEVLATTAVLSAAERARTLEQVEDEVFRFSRIVSGDRALASALSDRTAAPERLGTLVERLLGRKVTPQSLLLVRQAVTAPRGRRLEDALADVLDLAAARRSRLVAVATAAFPLSADQVDRLAAALGRVYGRQVLLEVDVDPEVLGGLRVRVGDEVLDATILTRLDEARRRLAG